MAKNIMPNDTFDIDADGSFRINVGNKILEFELVTPDKGATGIGKKAFVRLKAIIVEQSATDRALRGLRAGTDVYATRKVSLLLARLWRARHGMADAKTSLRTGGIDRDKP
jgi:hypothetical protein